MAAKLLIQTDQKIDGAFRLEVDFLQIGASVAVPAAPRREGVSSLAVIIVNQMGKSS